MDILDKYGETLLHIAAVSIRHGLYYGRAIPLDLDSFPAELNQLCATFVTLNRSGQLRGCIGSSRAWRALVEDIADNAFKAAFADQRFRPLLRHELQELDLLIALLTTPQPLIYDNQDELLSMICPGCGLILEDNNCKELLLPQDWKLVANRNDFLTRLKHRAGVSQHCWSETTRIYKFTAVSIKSTDLEDPRIIWNTPTDTV